LADQTPPGNLGSSGAREPRPSVAIPQLPPQRGHADEHPTGRRLAFLSLTALGIVYGDIGTSPLYAFREGFTGAHGFYASQANVYGLLSLITWALIGIVSIKYLVLVVRADNRGEGGMMSLLALVLQHEREATDPAQQKANKRKRQLFVMLAMFGTALLLGDGMITPAVSMLGAIEGLKVAIPALEPTPDKINWIVVITLVLLIGLFSVQRFGTAKVGGLFGPVTLLWFVTIAVLGGIEIAKEPHILAAISPHWAIGFFTHNGIRGVTVLGAVVLAVTGAEALYADMGHFGKRPIRMAWFAVALPSLLLNYFGQGALLLTNKAAAVNPFYLLAPREMLIPLVILATAATIVASQAMISGAFSLAQQCMQLGFSPRLSIIHTSYKQAGQIYVPEVNFAIMVGCILLVLYFQTADNLTAAYGIAVTGAFSITTVLFVVLAKRRWKWRPWQLWLFVAVFLLSDLALFGANAVKIPSGGWVTLAIALIIFIVLSTWKTGRAMLNQIINAGNLPIDFFLSDIARRKPIRVPGTAVFMTSSGDGVPVVLMHHYKHNQVLHEQVVLMSIKTEDVPEVRAEDRLTLEKLEHGFVRVIARYGFMEIPDIPEILYRLRQMGLRAKQMSTTFYLGRERILVIDRHRGPTPGAKRMKDDAEFNDMSRWRKRLFVIMHRNARSATESFGIPPNRVVEMGGQVEL
jgi:KUP system potassium uptake protein